MTRRERIQAAIAARDYATLVSAVPYAAYLGMAIEEAAGERHYRLPFRQDLIGNHRLPALHGGVVAGFMETAALFEVLISQSQYRIPKVIDFSIDYLRSGQPRDSIVGCRVLRHGRRVAQVQAEAWQSGRDRPIAFVRADFMVRDR